MAVAVVEGEETTGGEAEGEVEIDVEPEVEREAEMGSMNGDVVVGPFVNGAGEMKVKPKSGGGWVCVVFIGGVEDDGAL